MSAESTKRIMWFVSFMARHRHGVSKREIDIAWNNTEFSDSCSMEDRKGKSIKILPRPTFYRLITAALEIFNISIVFDKSTRLWQIDYEGDLRDNKFLKWLIDSFSVMGLANKNGALRRHLLFEPLAEGTENLEFFTTAIADKRTVRFKNYIGEKDRCQIFEMEPYILKIYKGCWYVIGILTEESYSELINLGTELAEKYRRFSLCRMLGQRNHLLSFPLYRLTDISITKKKYEIPECFNPEDFKGDLIGPDLFYNHIDKKGLPQGSLGDRFCTPVMEVTIKAKGYACVDLSHRQIHQSQEFVRNSKEENSNDPYHIYKFRIRPTREFLLTLLNYGPYVEVLEPLSVRTNIKKLIEQTLANYN